MTLALSAATLERERRLFQGTEQELVIKKLEEQCGNNLPFCEDATPESSERVRYAVLKLSNGSLNQLDQALHVAQVDWRDVLVAAGFASDVNAHHEWMPPLVC